MYCALSRYMDQYWSQPYYYVLVLYVLFRFFLNFGSSSTMCEMIGDRGRWTGGYSLYFLLIRIYPMSWGFFYFIFSFGGLAAGLGFVAGTAWLYYTQTPLKLPGIYISSLLVFFPSHARWPSIVTSSVVVSAAEPNKSPASGLISIDYLTYRICK